jgi:hypothetical protein
MINDVQRLRGVILNSYAQVEFLAADFAVKCKHLPQYNELVKKFPYATKKRVEAVKEIATAPGPISPYRVELTSQIGRLLQFEELRNFMAHGFLSITPSLDPRLEFRMYVLEPKVVLSLRILCVQLEELKHSADDIRRYTHDFVTLVRSIYLKERLEA